MTDAEAIALIKNAKTAVMAEWNALPAATRRLPRARKGSRAERIRGEHGILMFGGAVSISRLGMTETEARAFLIEHSAVLVGRPDRHRHLEAIALRPGF